MRREMFTVPAMLAFCVWSFHDHFPIWASIASFIVACVDCLT